MTRRPLLVGALVAIGLTVTDVPSPLRLAPALRLRTTLSVNGACPGVEPVSVGFATSVTYCYTVTNIGTTQTRDIVITDRRGSVRIGTLRGGQSLTLARTIPVAPDAGWLAVEPGVATATEEPVAGTAEAANTDGPTSDLSATAIAPDTLGERHAIVSEGQTALVLSGATPVPPTTLQSP